MKKIIERLISSIKSKTFCKDSLQLNGAGVTDDDLHALLGELSKHDEYINSIKTLELGSNKLKIIDLSCFTGTLSNIYLQDNPELRIVIFNPYMTFHFVELLSPNINMATKIAVQAIYERSKKINPDVQVYVSGYDSDGSVMHFEQMDLPPLSAEILDDYFAYLFEEYNDVVIMHNYLNMLITSPESENNSIDSIREICSCVRLERAVELLNLLHNSVNMFVNVLPETVFNGAVLANYLREENLTLETLGEWALKFRASKMTI